MTLHSKVHESLTVEHGRLLPAPRIAPGDALGHFLRKSLPRTPPILRAKLWGLSSAGRAPDLHSGGQEFDPPRLHHFFFGYLKETKMMIGSSRASADVFDRPIGRFDIV